MRESWSCSWISPLEVFVQLRRLFLSSPKKMASSSAAAEAMVCTRQGRHRQRYEGCYRLVSGCIPYMLKDDGENSCKDEQVVLERLQVLMISTPKRSNLIFPKGGWEDDESIDEAACREAFEEAGVKGIISQGKVLTCSKWYTTGRVSFQEQEQAEQLWPRRGLQGLHVCPPGVQVTELLESWPEQVTHGRRWVPVGEAYGLCRYDWMREALDKLKEQLPFGSSFRAPPSPSQEPPADSSASMYMVMPAVAEGAVALC